MDNLLTDIIGKDIVTVEGNKLGTIINLTADKFLKKIKNIVYFDSDEEEKQIAYSGILSSDKQIVMFKNIKEKLPNSENLPIKIKAYDIDSRYLGTITNFMFVDRDIINIELDYQIIINPINLVSFGNEIAVFDFSDKPFKTKRTSTKECEINFKKEILSMEKNHMQEQQTIQLENNEQQTIQLENNEDDFLLIKENLNNEEAESLITKNEKKAEESVALETEKAEERVALETEKAEERVALEIEKAEERVALETEKVEERVAVEIEKPQSIVLGGKFLIGRKVKKDIYYYGLLLIEKGTIISQNTLKTAISHGKLFELTVSSMGNVE